MPVLTEAHQTYFVPQTRSISPRRQLGGGRALILFQFVPPAGSATTQSVFCKQVETKRSLGLRARAVAVPHQVSHKLVHPATRIMAHLVAVDLDVVPSVAPPPLPAGSLGSLLTALGSPAGERLKTRSAPDGRLETIAVCEATTGGLVQAALQAVPGASRYYHGGTNIYGAVCTHPVACV